MNKKHGINNSIPEQISDEDLKKFFPEYVSEKSQDEIEQIKGLVNFLVTTASELMDE